MQLQFILLPLVGALIGWLTNKLAVYLIFRPYEPVKLPLLPCKIHGLLPKRRAELAYKIGQVVEQELLSIDDVVLQLRSPDMVHKVVQSVQNTVQGMVENKLPLWVPLSFKKNLSKLFSETVERKLPSIIEEILDQTSSEFKNKISIMEMVESKLNKYPIKHVESIVTSVAAKELKHIEFLGAVLGFVIGLVQAVIFTFFR
ncbi:MAG: DUF445 family protein [Desulfotomaculum sp.]|nr:DUF445 family protein [Desulfotomaculum sp.]